MLDVRVGSRGEAAARGDEAWVLRALEPDQLVAAKAGQHYGRRRLGPATRVLMWAMRVYALFMLIVVAYQVWSTLHAAG